MQGVSLEGQVGRPTPGANGDRALTFTRIQPSSGWVPVRWGEFWEARELLYFFIWRDIKVRYKQTVIGALWAIIQPVFTMVIFSLFFGRLAGVPSDGIPYPLFSFAALVPWTLFATAISQASVSLVGNANMLKKIYFPRLMLPTATVLAGVLDFILAFVVLLIMMVAYGTFPTLRILWIPLLLLLALTTSLGVSFWLAALSVQFRDVRYVLPFLLQSWMFITPIAYSSSMLPQPWRTLYGINPMAGVVDGFRWALLGSDAAPGPMLALSSVIALGLLIGGMYYFQRMERTFADVA